MADKFLLEDGSGGFQLEDASGDILLEASVAGTNIAAQFDWPAPVGAARARTLRHDQPVNPTVFYTQPQERIYRSPLYHNIPKRRPVYVDPVTNITVLTAPVVTTPTTQDDWPLPAPHRKVANAHDPQRFQISQVPGPYNQDDWPDPLGNKQQARDSTSLTLVPLQSPQVSPPYNQDDWPLPNKARPAVNTPDLQATPVTAAPQIPTFQTDWPLPGGHRLALDSTRGTLQPLQAPQVPAPYNQDDWPLPNNHRRVANTPDPQRFEIPSVPGPYSQGDWPLPKKVRQVANTPDLQATPVVVPSPAFFQTDWPLPARRKPQAFDWSELTLQPIHSPQVLPPYGNDDWPLPRKRYPTIQDQDRQKSLITIITTQTIRQSEWPLPAMPRRTNLDPSWVNNNFLINYYRCQGPFDPADTGPTEGWNLVSAGGTESWSPVTGGSESWSAVSPGGTEVWSPVTGGSEIWTTVTKRPC